MSYDIGETLTCTIGETLTYTTGETLTPFGVLKGGLRRLTVWLRATQEYRRFYPVHQHGVVPRFGDEIEGTIPHSLHCQINGAPCSHQDDWYIGSEHFHLFQQGKSLLTIGGEGVVHVHQHQLQVRMVAHHLHCCHRAIGTRHHVAVTLQQQGQCHPDGSVVVNYQNHIKIFFAKVMKSLELKVER